MQPRNRAGTILEYLKDELPSCFKRGNAKQPLAKNIHHQLLEYYEDDYRFSRSALRDAIKYYVSSKRYIKTLKEDAERIDLHGRVVGQVTQQEAQYAEFLLANRPNPNKAIRLHCAKTKKSDIPTTQAKVVRTNQQTSYSLNRFSLFAQNGAYTRQNNRLVDADSNLSHYESIIRI